MMDLVFIVVPLQQAVHLLLLAQVLISVATVHLLHHYQIEIARELVMRYNLFSVGLIQTYLTIFGNIGSIYPSIRIPLMKVEKNRIARVIMTLLLITIVTIGKGIIYFGCPISYAAIHLLI
jgi:hypothetical protein